MPINNALVNYQNFLTTCDPTFSAGNADKFIGLLHDFDNKENIIYTHWVTDNKKEEIRTFFRYAEIIQENYPKLNFVLRPEILALFNRDASSSSEMESLASTLRKKFQSLFSPIDPTNETTNAETLSARDFVIACVCTNRLDCLKILCAQLFQPASDFLSFFFETYGINLSEMAKLCDAKKVDAFLEKSSSFEEKLKKQDLIAYSTFKNQWESKTSFSEIEFQNFINSKIDLSEPKKKKIIAGLFNWFKIRRLFPILEIPFFSEHTSIFFGILPNFSFSNEQDALDIAKKMKETLIIAICLDNLSLAEYFFSIMKTSSKKLSDDKKILAFFYKKLNCSLPHIAAVCATEKLFIFLRAHMSSEDEMTNISLDAQPFELGGKLFVSYSLAYVALILAGNQDLLESLSGDNRRKFLDSEIRKHEEIPIYMHTRSQERSKTVLEYLLQTAPLVSVNRALSEVPLLSKNFKQILFLLQAALSNPDPMVLARFFDNKRNSTKTVLVYLIEKAPQLFSLMPEKDTVTLFEMAAKGGRLTVLRQVMRQHFKEAVKKEETRQEKESSSDVKRMIKEKMKIGKLGKASDKTTIEQNAKKEIMEKISKKVEETKQHFRKELLYKLICSLNFLTICDFLTASDALLKIEVFFQPISNLLPKQKIEDAKLDFETTCDGFVNFDNVFQEYKDVLPLSKIKSQNIDLLCSHWFFICYKAVKEELDGLVALLLIFFKTYKEKIESTKSQGKINEWKLRIAQSAIKGKRLSSLLFESIIESFSLTSACVSVPNHFLDNFENIPLFYYTYCLGSLEMLRFWVDRQPYTNPIFYFSREKTFELFESINRRCFNQDHLKMKAYLEAPESPLAKLMVMLDGYFYSLLPNKKEKNVDPILRNAITEILEKLRGIEAIENIHIIKDIFAEFFKKYKANSSVIIVLEKGFKQVKSIEEEMMAISKKVSLVTALAASPMDNIWKILENDLGNYANKEALFSILGREISSINEQTIPPNTRSTIFGNNNTNNNNNNNNSDLLSLSTSTLFAFPPGDTNGTETEAVPNKLNALHHSN